MAIVPYAGHNGWTKCPVSHWEIEYRGPLPVSEGHKYPLTCMDMSIGLIQAFAHKRANQTATTKELTMIEGSDR